MTCYLDYVKIGKLEVLQGTFISSNAKNKKDCGNGKVYLERVSKSDFELEDFLANPKPQTPITQKKPNVKLSITAETDQTKKKNNCINILKTMQYAEETTVIFEGNREFLYN